MGLDQYLSKKTYVKRWAHQKDEEQYQVTVTRGGKPVSSIEINPDRISYIEEEIGTWRKAYAIQEWFNLCVSSHLTGHTFFPRRDQLEELLGIVRKVMAASTLVNRTNADGTTTRVIEDPSVAKELLPTFEMDYDDWYYDHLVETELILMEALEDPEADEFEYYASW